MGRLRFAWRLARILGLLLVGALLAALLSLRYRDSAAGAIVRGRLRRWWLASLSRTLPFRVKVIGHVPQAPMLWLANHISWSDIPLLGQFLPMAFLSKAEVRQWPLIGWLAAQAGTLFIQRGAGDGARVCHALSEQLRQGHSVLLFPEGTTTAGDGLRTFHPRLMAAAIEANVSIQPVALRYRRDGERDPIAPFIGDDDLISHLRRLLGSPVAEVEIHLLAPISSHGVDRATLARQAHAAIASVVLEHAHEDFRRAA